MIQTVVSSAVAMQCEEIFSESVDTKCRLIDKEKSLESAGRLGTLGVTSLPIQRERDGFRSEVYSVFPKKKHNRNP